jgi:hypothetical protein
MKTAKLFLMVVLITGAGIIALAKPAFMDRYNGDPYSKPEFRGKCTVCHIGKGGGERNDFGEAFEDNGYRITSKLRAKFPALFSTTRNEAEMSGRTKQQNWLVTASRD